MASRVIEKYPSMTTSVHFKKPWEALGAEVVERYGRHNPRRAALADTSVPALQRLRAHFDRLNEA
jgi:TetR/AcrR family transcriptional repressor of nem operon